MLRLPKYCTGIIRIFRTFQVYVLRFSIETAEIWKKWRQKHLLANIIAISGCQGHPKFFHFLKRFKVKMNTTLVLLLQENLFTDRILEPWELGSHSKTTTVQRIKSLERSVRFSLMKAETLILNEGDSWPREGESYINFLCEASNNEHGSKNLMDLGDSELHTSLQRSCKPSLHPSKRCKSGAEWNWNANLGTFEPFAYYLLNFGSSIWKNGVQFSGVWEFVSVLILVPIEIMQIHWSAPFPHFCYTNSASHHLLCIAECYQDQLHGWNEINVLITKSFFAL